MKGLICKPHTFAMYANFLDAEGGYHHQAEAHTKHQYICLQEYHESDVKLMKREGELTRFEVLTRDLNPNP